MDLAVIQSLSSFIVSVCLLTTISLSPCHCLRPYLRLSINLVVCPLLSKFTVRVSVSLSISVPNYCPCLRLSINLAVSPSLSLSLSPSLYQSGCLRVSDSAFLVLVNWISFFFFSFLHRSFGGKDDQKYKVQEYWKLLEAPSNAIMAPRLKTWRGKRAPPPPTHDGMKLYEPDAFLSWTKTSFQWVCERSKQNGASEWVSNISQWVSEQVSKWASGKANGLVVNASIPQLF